MPIRPRAIDDGNGAPEPLVRFALDGIDAHATAAGRECDRECRFRQTIARRQRASVEAALGEQVRELRQDLGPHHLSAYTGGAPGGKIESTAAVLRGTADAKLVAERRTEGERRLVIGNQLQPESGSQREARRREIV